MLWHEAEQVILSFMLRGEEYVKTAYEYVKADMFLSDTHGALFRLLGEMRERGADINPVTVAMEIKARGAAEYGGVEYIQELSELQFTMPEGEFRGVLRRFVDMWVDRQLIHLSRRINAWVESAVPGMLGKVEQYVERLRRLRVPEVDIVHLDEARKRLLERIEAKEALHVRMPCGLDIEITTGRLMVVVSDTSLGKTAFGIQLAIANADHCPVLICTLEQGIVDIAARALAVMNITPIREVLSGEAPLEPVTAPVYLARPEPRLAHVLDVLSDACIRLGCRVVIVDYIQLIRTQARERRFELEEVINALGDFANTYDVLVCVLSQIGSIAETREAASIKHRCDAMVAIFDVHQAARLFGWQVNKGHDHERVLAIRKLRPPVIGDIKQRLVCKITPYVTFAVLEDSDPQKWLGRDLVKEARDDAF